MRLRLFDGEGRPRNAGITQGLASGLLATMGPSNPGRKSQRSRIALNPVPALPGERPREIPIAARACRCGRSMRGDAPASTI